MTSQKWTTPDWLDAWTAYQRASLARIFQQLEADQDSQAISPGCFSKSSAQSTQCNLDLFSSKTLPESEPEAGSELSKNYWRADIPTETERLVPLLSVRRTSETGGGYLLPTLTAKGNYRTEKQSKKAGDGMIQALRKLPTLTASKYGSQTRPNGKKGASLKNILPTLTRADGEGKTTVNMTYKGGNPTLPRAVAYLPTLCATDYKSPYSAAGYQQQKQKRSKPLRDTLKHTTGNRLSPSFAEWFMGFPINYTASVQWETRKFRK